jgi:hypothetical protein
MTRFLSTIRLLSLGGAKACTLGPNSGKLVEEDFIQYQP